MALDILDPTLSSQETSVLNHPVSLPACSAGDLVFIHMATYGSYVTTIPTGPNGETLTQQAQTSTSYTALAKSFWFIASAAFSATTITFQTSVARTSTASVFRVAAGEFNEIQPIYWCSTSNNSAAGLYTSTTTDASPYGRLRVALWDIQGSHTTDSGNTGYVKQVETDFGFHCAGIATKLPLTTSGDASMPSPNMTFNTSAGYSYSVLLISPAVTIHEPTVTNTNINVTGTATPELEKAPLWEQGYGTGVSGTTFPLYFKAGSTGELYLFTAGFTNDPGTLTWATGPNGETANIVSAKVSNAGIYYAAAYYILTANCAAGYRYGSTSISIGMHSHSVKAAAGTFDPANPLTIGVASASNDNWNGDALGVTAPGTPGGAPLYMEMHYYYSTGGVQDTGWRNPFGSNANWANSIFSERVARTTANEVIPNRMNPYYVGASTYAVGQMVVLNPPSQGSRVRIANGDAVLVRMANGDQASLRLADGSQL